MELVKFQKNHPPKAPNDLILLKLRNFLASNSTGGKVIVNINFGSDRF